MADKCLKCGGEEKVKNGIVKDKQRWKCVKCGYNFRVSISQGYSNEIKQLALRMYLEGVGMRSIGRIVGVSNVTVLRWVKKAARALIKLKQKEPRHARIMEIDEMYTYAAKKTANTGCGWLLIEIPEKSLGIGSVIVERKP